MSTEGSDHSDVIFDPPVPVNTLTSDDESFVFNRELTSEHNRQSTFDVNREGTFDVADNPAHDVNNDVDINNDATTERHNDVDTNSDCIDGVLDGVESDSDGESTFVDEQLKELAAQSMISEKTEYLMSELEIAEWDRRMAEMVDRFRRHQEDHVTWGSDLARRRLAAIERLKRLKEGHRRRLELYGAVTGYIGDLNSIINDMAT